MSGYTDSGDVQRGNVGLNTSNMHQQMPDVAVYGGARRDGAEPDFSVQHQQASAGGVTPVGHQLIPHSKDAEYESDNAEPTQESYLELLIKKNSGTAGFNPEFNMQQWMTR